MTDAERAAKLDAAVALITDIIDSLDQSKSICECCKLIKFTNWTDHVHAGALRGAVIKLNNRAESFRRRNDIKED